MEVLYLASKYEDLGAEAVARGGGDQQGTGFFKSIRLQLQSGEISKPYAQHIWTYACINAVATAIKSVPFIVVKDSANGGRTRTKELSEKIRAIRAMRPKDRGALNPDELKKRDLEVVESGPIYELFRDVNPLMTRAQLWEATVIHRWLSGACAWILESGQDGPVKEGKWPGEIWPFGPDGLKPIIKNGMLKGFKREQSDQFEAKTYKPHQVLWFWKYNPYGGYMDGLGNYEVVKSSAEQDYKAQVWNTAFLDNSGDAGGILEIPSFVKEDKVKLLLNQWNDRHGGPGKQNKTGVLLGGAKYDRTPVSHKDMDFLEMRKWNRDEALAGYGVPRQLVQIFEDINRATAHVVHRQFWEQTIIPEMVYYEDLIDSKLMVKVPEAAGYYVMFDLSKVEALREDLALQAETAERYNKIGIPTEDIINSMELPVPIHSWQKQWWVPLSLVPVGEDGKQEDDDPKEDSIGTIASQRVGDAVAVIERKMDKKRHWKLWVAKVLDPVEIPYRRRIKKYWFDLRVAQLKQWNEMTKGLPSEGELAGYLFDNDVWQQKLSDLSMPFYEMAAGLSIEQVADELGTPAWNIEDPRVIAIMQQKAKKIKDVTDRFWHRLRDNMAEGLQANETVAEIATRIREQFNNAASPAKTLMVARTETAQTASTVRNTNFKFEGVKKHEWNTSGDGDVRKDHEIFGALKPVSMAFDYITEAKHVVEGHLYFPSDPNAAPGHSINCRCVELPVV